MASQEAKAAIRNVFEEQVFLSWVAKWPGENLIPKVGDYDRGLIKLHTTTPATDPIPPARIGHSGVAIEIWLDKRGDLIEKWFANDGRDGNYERAFLEQMYENSFIAMMERQREPVSSIDDLLVEGASGRREDPALAKTLMRTLVGHMLGLAVQGVSRGNAHILQLQKLCCAAEEAAGGGPEVSDEIEMEMSRISGGGRDWMVRGADILGELERFLAQ